MDDLSLFNAGDPFYGTIRFDVSVTSVAVEAVNCNGQKAIKMVNYTDGCFVMAFTHHPCNDHSFSLRMLHLEDSMRLQEEHLKNK